MEGTYLTQLCPFRFKARQYRSKYDSHSRESSHGTNLPSSSSVTTTPTFNYGDWAILRRLLGMGRVAKSILQTRKRLKPIPNQGLYDFGEPEEPFGEARTGDGRGRVHWEPSLRQSHARQSFQAGNPRRLLPRKDEEREGFEGPVGH